MKSKDEIIRFSLLVEEMVRTKRVSYMDAVIEQCTLNGIEIELASRLISPAIKAKISHEAERLNFIPKTKKLPFIS